MHDFAIDKMFLDDSFEHWRRAGVIPNRFGIYDGDGSGSANAKAIGFGSIYERLRTDQIQLFEAPLQVFPGFEPDFLRSAFGLGLIRAEKNMALILFQTKAFGGGFQFIGHS